MSSCANEPVLDEAMAWRRAGHLNAAECACLNVIVGSPLYAPAWHLLGVIASQLGRHDEAVKLIARAIQLDSKEAIFYSDLGVVFTHLERYESAVFACRRSLALKADLPEAHYNLGIALKNMGQFDQVVLSFKRVLVLDPHHERAMNNLGIALYFINKTDEAIACWRAAIQLNPTLVLAYIHLGHAMAEKEELDEAIALLRRALRLNPKAAAAHFTLGNVFRRKNCLKKASVCYRRVLKINSNHSAAHNALGLVLRELARTEINAERRGLSAAATCFRNAISLQPDLIEAHLNLSATLLLRGRFQEGWTEYEWRRNLPDFPGKCLTSHRWLGEPLHDKAILLHAEQGFGDSIQFIRFARPLKNLGAKVIFACQEPLLRIMRSCVDIDRLIPSADATFEAFDVQASLLSLPSLFGIRLESIPVCVPYLSAESALLKLWKDRLASQHGFKVGIAWQGNPKHTGDRERSIPLQCFRSLAQLPGVVVYSLQKEHGIEQISSAELKPIDLREELNDFADTAALIEALDLVITCDTAVAHLAGAMGRPTWLCISHNADWRWLLRRESSPWYPTLRLFRQVIPGDWNGVLKRVGTRLVSIVQGEFEKSRYGPSL